ncbi:MAG TPA: histidine phosphatase family protein [Chitinophagaceae bacterium]|nr:histidine phosphatase family protein [Chitinophagaceae bacterium]
MRYLLIAIVVCICVASCSSQRYYVVRHAEKLVITKDSAGMMASNPPLSEPGKVRSFVLRSELQHKKISHIFSTNYLRTKSTAQPLSDTIGIPIVIYSPSRDSVTAFDARLKALKGNVLVVGHSNTVDDIVNKLTGRTDIPGDLSETEYDNLFIVTKKGKKWLFERKKYGYPSNP